MRAFLAVADALQFRVAAARLHVTQPALSRIIKSLEEAVGAMLLARTTRSVQLTNAGRVFAEQCRLARFSTPIVAGFESGEAGNLPLMRAAGPGQSSLRVDSAHNDAFVRDLVESHLK